MVVEHDKKNDKKKTQKHLSQDCYLLPSSVLTQALNVIADPISIKNEQHQYIFLNDAFCQFQGLTREELIGKTVYDIYPPQEADVFVKQDRVAYAAGCACEHEAYLTDSRGKQHIISSTKTVFEVQDEPFAGEKILVETLRDLTPHRHQEINLKKRNRDLETLVELQQSLLRCHRPQRISRDITDRQRATHALEQRERYLSTLVEVQRRLLISPDTTTYYTEILELLGQASGASRVYLFENHQDWLGKVLMSQRTEWCAPGISPELNNPQLQNLSYDDFFPRWAEALHQGEIINGVVTEFPESERVVLEPQGILSILILPLVVKQKFWGFIGFDNCSETKAWESSEVSLISAAASAISLHLERHQAGQALQESEEKFRQLAENIDSVFWITNPQKGQMIYVSPAYETLWGRTCTELYENPITFIEAIHPEDRPLVMAALAKQSQGIYHEECCLEYRIVRPDGEIHWIRDRAFPIQDETGIVYRVVGIAEDISDQKYHETALQLIVEGTAAKIGDEFFRSLVRYLAEVLKVRYALVTRFVAGTQSRVRTLAFWNGNSFGDNFEYDLDGTPCEGVIMGNICHYPTQVQAQFPQDQDLVNLRVESYSGIPLKDSANRILGHLAVMHTQPMTDDHTPKLIVKIFAARAGAELERLNAAEALQTTQKRLQYLVASSPAMIYTCSPIANYPITFVSENIRDVLGYTAQECLASAKTFWISRVHPEDLAQVLTNHQQLATQGYSVNEYRFLHRDGTYCWLRDEVKVTRDDAGQLVELIGSTIKISDRKQAEEEVRQSEERLQLALEGSALGLWDWHLSDNQVYLSPQWKLMLGYEPHELEDSYSIWEQLIHPEDLSTTREVFNAHLEGHTPVYQAEFRMATKQGGWKWILSHGKVFEWDQLGQPVRVTGTHQDISDRKAIDQMKDEFISIISHELRTPMTSIHGSLKLLSTGMLGNLTEKGQRMLEIAISNTDRLSRLINDILDLQRLESGQFSVSKQPCHALSLIEQAIAALQVIAQKQQIQLEIMDHPSPTLWASSDYILQVLINLLSNAIKFSEPETTVKIGVLQHEQKALFYIKDQGRGVPGDKLESIFGRFQQVDASDAREKGGTGLGLAICRRIIELHEGQIWVESVLDQGSTFYFTCQVI
ncbi:MAG: PAS domain-containing protein [Microcoleaceae cyanobacterium]